MLPGLEFLHKNGIVYGDVKMENLLVKEGSIDDWKHLVLVLPIRLNMMTK